MSVLRERFFRGAAVVALSLALNSTVESQTGGEGDWVPSAAEAKGNVGVNMRDLPTTSSEVEGVLQEDPVVVSGFVQRGQYDWYLLENGNWVREDVVNLQGSKEHLVNLEGDDPLTRTLRKALYEESEDGDLLHKEGLERANFSYLYHSLSTIVAQEEMDNSVLLEGISVGYRSREGAVGNYTVFFNGSSVLLAVPGPDLGSPHVFVTLNFIEDVVEEPVFFDKFVDGLALYRGESSDSEYYLNPDEMFVRSDENLGLKQILENSLTRLEFATDIEREVYNSLPEFVKVQVLAGEAYYDEELGGFVRENEDWGERMVWRNGVVVSARSEEAGWQMVADSYQHPDPNTNRVLTVEFNPDLMAELNSGVPISDITFAAHLQEERDLNERLEEVLRRYLDKSVHIVFLPEYFIDGEPHPDLTVHGYIRDVVVPGISESVPYYAYKLDFLPNGSIVVHTWISPVELHPYYRDRIDDLQFIQKVVSAHYSQGLSIALATAFFERTFGNGWNTLTRRHWIKNGIGYLLGGVEPPDIDPNSWHGQNPYANRRQTIIVEIAG